MARHLRFQWWFYRRFRWVGSEKVRRSAPGAVAIEHRTVRK